MEVFFAALAIVMVFAFFKSLLASTFGNLKILTGLQRGRYLIRLDYVDEYAVFAMCIEGMSIVIVILAFLSSLDTGFAYTNLVKTLLFMFLSLILFMFLGVTTWAVGVLVTSKFSMVEKSEVYSDLVLSGFAGQFARIKIGHVFLVHAITVSILLSVAIYVIYKVFIIILVPIITWLFTP